VLTALLLSGATNLAAVGCSTLSYSTKSQALAATLDIELVWLPKQCSELNGMDHLWRELKDDISANYQFSSIDEHADVAEDYIFKLSNRQALRRAGILSKNFWLKSFL